MVWASPSEKSPSEVLQAFRDARQGSPIVAVVSGAEPALVTEMIAQGANDFIIPPLRPADVLPRVWRLIGQQEKDDSDVEELKQKLGLTRLVGESPLFIAELKKISAIAQCHASVLITGETGTGKEVYARAVHQLSPRAGSPFLVVNCGAIPVELIENELFGHQAGAYTSALSAATGLVREAEGGTLFLDEINSLPLPAQSKLLRLLQDREYVPLGSAKVCKADIRVIAATNTNLEEAVRTGQFRKDLFYRLNVIPVTLPSLRDRAADVRRLARHFLSKFSSQLGKGPKELSPAAMQTLVAYDWPGNVRELENIIERAVVLSSAATIESVDIQLPQPVHACNGDSFRALKAKVVAQFERQYIEDALAQYGSIGKAARAAGKNRRAFWELMRKHDIRPTATA
jgi:DNA-binding NtrC family response regulator